MSETVNAKEMPVLFIGHGNPMNAIEESETTRNWARSVEHLQPRAILCVSAHWETDGPWLTGQASPPTIHDFYGFPDELHRYSYPAPGDPALATHIQQVLSEYNIGISQEWGLDHGSWSVLCRMFPAANVPVVQLGMDRKKPAAFHYELGKRLAFLRQENILILCSGNIVHNLGLARFGWSGAYDWALAFDSFAAERILSTDTDALIQYMDAGEMARLSVPTREHYLPLLYALGAASSLERVTFFNEEVIYGSLSMRSVIWS
ncbi:MAG: 4,5-DOPA dioxygenase extradiol [Spirochaetales bacterium]|nr:4,5-DOPA dioxygenase extradiol [Spirochaetales bacterium]